MKLYIKIGRVFLVSVIAITLLISGCLDNETNKTTPTPEPTIEPTPVVEENWLTPAAVVTCCGEEEGFPASASIDGNLSTYWGHIKGEAHWIIYDLGSAQNISKIRIYTDSGFGGAPCKLFIYTTNNESLLSNGNETKGWQRAGESGTIPPSLHWTEVKLTNATGRYLKIYPYTHFKPTGTCGWYFSLGGFREIEYLPREE